MTPQRFWDVRTTHTPEESSERNPIPHQRRVSPCTQISSLLHGGILRGEYVHFAGSTFASIFSYRWSCELTCIFFFCARCQLIVEVVMGGSLKNRNGRLTRRRKAIHGMTNTPEGQNDLLLIGLVVEQTSSMHCQPLSPLHIGARLFLTSARRSP
jgi:hypothetical protein